MKPPVRIAGLAALGLALALPARADGRAGVSVQIGPTPIPHGSARGAHDITLVNDRIAVAFAVDTAPPWGVPRGGIVDVAVVRDGAVDADRAALVDFMPADWSGWPGTYQRVRVDTQTPDEAVVRTERDWGEVDLVTTWTLRAGEDVVRLHTRMHNRGKTTLTGLLSGYVMWPEGGHLFGLPGAPEQERGRVAHPLADWSAAYDRDWAMGLHTPFADRIGDGGRDRYLQHDLAPGATREFEGWLQVAPRGELAPLVARQIAFDRLPAGTLSGTVRAVDGTALATPALVVEARGASGWTPYTWAVGAAGRYSLQLPAGHYRVRASAEAYADSATQEIEMGAGTAQTLDFADLQPPGEVSLRVLAGATRAPLDARVRIATGPAPLIGYFGQTTFFTGLERKGQLDLRIPPGDYRFAVEAAAGFRAPLLHVNARVRPGASLALDAPVDQRADPAAEGWYSGDLHHHSDVLDGYTEPQYVLRAQLAAGLDVGFLSDHDSVVNNREMQRLAALRGVPCIPATEFSPSWAHFNAFPLDADKSIAIDTGGATVQQIFAEARRMGARVIAVNHPYINYGYFRSAALGQVPGGYSADFDLVEVNGSDENAQTVEHAWRLWNEGQHAYLTAGSDVHDVWKERSGSARVLVKLDGSLEPLAFVAALKAGHSYVSQGPLVFPAQLFGSELRLAPGATFDLSGDVQAVDGLASVTLIERGKPVARKDMGGVTSRTPIAFPVGATTDTWFSLVLEDANGRKAWTNPVWVTTSAR